ncbi:hypothetical protein PYJP_02040 [Pyrofollis japonicus]|uniref:hypothetical protein n=1 Tax=Pyrofollis japonicus TaxID=3060460 RepID=UPI00295B8424|nr:hypothetical protein [Pyrofollis japonicus]BEP16852.1 hypothetical protein PYJP_02040 [Pyrofollis japonicus]
MQTRRGNGIVYGEEVEASGWRLRRNGVARIEFSDHVMRLCMGPTEALYYSNAEISDGGFDKLPHSSGVLEVNARLTRLHYGSAGWGFWNYSMRIDMSYPVWFIYLNTPGPYLLRGFFAQTGNVFTPIRLDHRDRWERLYFRLVAALTRLGMPLVPIRITSTRPAMQDLDLTKPHNYRIEWKHGEAKYYIDGKLVARHTAKQLQTRVDIWIDNAVYEPRRGDPGRVYRHVTMENREEACLEIIHL